MIDIFNQFFFVYILKHNDFFPKFLGAQSRFISTALMHLANFEGKRASTVESIKKAFEDDKITRDDVFLNVRMAQGMYYNF